MLTADDYLINGYSNKIAGLDYDYHMHTRVTRKHASQSRSILSFNSIMVDQGGVIETGKDQIKGSSNDWYTVQDFTSIRSESAQLVMG